VSVDVEDENAVRAQIARGPGGQRQAVEGAEAGTAVAPGVVETAGEGTGHAIAQRRAGRRDGAAIAREHHQPLLQDLFG
jgi:hypothetical protein